MFRPSRPTVIAATLATTAALTLPLATTASADPTDRSENLQERVTLDGVLDHLEAFQDIADENGGNRAAGLPGYAASADYVAQQMRSAGYKVRQQKFEFDFFQELSTPQFEQTAPDATTYAEGDDFATMTFSGSTAPESITGTIEPVDLALSAPETSTSGCETEDFAGFTAGNVALIQRGTCTFAQKAENAQAAGAVGAVILNQGNGADRSGVLNGTLGGDVVDIPVLGTSFAIGQDLADPAGTTVRIFTDTVSEPRITTNVIANSRYGNPNNVVMLGAHLDSVPEGPGYNDNATGSAAILEVAQEMADVRPENKMRFAWWGAEELGLVGSTDYVESLPPGQLRRIALYLNFDMVGSPNFIRGVYDGDGSDFGLTGPPGSDAIEAMFNEHFASESLPFQATEFSGRSDYQAFINNGIPSGGLFTGADGVKTEAEEEMYGGVAGSIYDPCYHEACDSSTPVADGADADVYAELIAENDLVGNVAPEALDTNADAIAHAAITYAFDTSTVNGVGPKPGQSTSAAGHAGPHAGPHLHGAVKR
ncbi:MAG TPA: M28 family peptidase [Nocardioidaceae bacterium]|nr:M28 family peptidase [Nocardioidaceae bacterium]